MSYSFCIGVLVFIQVVNGCHYERIEIWNSTYISSEFNKPPVLPLKLWDCPCGGGGQLRDPKAAITLRPWVVKISVEVNGKIVKNCSGSVLNHRWIITAAHCFCKHLGKCNSAKDKTFTDPKKAILMEFVNGKKLGAKQIVVHPNYKPKGEGSDEESPDVALVETNAEIGIVDNNGTAGNPIPICLSPKPGMSTKLKFEDLDCTEEKDHSKVCHPGVINDPLISNVMSRTSFISSFGEVGTPPDKSRFCRTNQYGPKFAFARCAGECYPNEERNVSFGGEVKFVANPSFGNKVCQQYFNEFVESGQMDKDFNTRTVDTGISKSRFHEFYYPAKINIENKDNNFTIHCYPFMDTEQANKAHIGPEQPYAHGWCRVCDNTTGTSASCQPLVDGIPAFPATTNSQALDWGWCLPECSAPDVSKYEAKEMEVESYTCEGAKHMDICVESRTRMPYTLNYQIMGTEDNPSLKYVSGGISNYINPDQLKTMKKTHNEYAENLCHGDEGAGVWKLWKFEDAEVDPPKQRAVLTGVLSRPENQCLDEHNGNALPALVFEDLTIVARVSMFTDWILSIISSGKCIKVA